MSEHYKYFENNQCEYYPCHKGTSRVNCLFCYCPMYPYEGCLGNPKYIDVAGKTIKDCSDCIFPHSEKNYDAIMQFIKSKQ
jgi:Zn-finger protein